MAKDVIRSGVTFNRDIYSKLDKVINDSKRFKIDKSEIINAILSKTNLSPKKIQEIVMDWREEKWKSVYLFCFLLLYLWG